MPATLPTRDLLTRDEAAARARRVHDPAYDISIDLRREGWSYEGRCRIEFGLTSPDEPLFIDFRGREIRELSVNGRDVVPDLRDNRLWLDPALLGPRMQVSMSYSSDFDQAGDGFSRFVDPEDGEVYVHTNFQPFAAHRLFPCFDQPDLKAVFRLAVTTPEDWAVVSATHAVSSEARNGTRRHRFAESERFSTYLASLIAGPYHAVRGEHRGIPFGIYGRRTLRRQLDAEADEILELTGQGFDYYADLFDHPYPFSKYDQLFVPEFNIGAMENVGAVTIHDGYIFRDPPTETQRLQRAEVMLHELAHMWFGNLVTMRWWDDLWLNESFATYVSFLALTEATRFRGAWKTFNGTIKRLAYRQDQLVTTHPISADATDTDTALLNFDDITYGKGASVLKQLVARIGRDGFRDGMRAYFRRHAWGNASLTEFLAALEEGSGVELGSWSKLWLETASLNTIVAEVQADDGRIESLRLLQSAPAGFPALRPHAMRVALLADGPAGRELTVLPAAIDGAIAPVPGAGGLPVPRLVFPNHDDHDYAKVRLDARSLEFVRTRLRDVADPLLRQLLWTSLWDMVRDAELPPTEFLATCRGALPVEPDLELLDNVLANAGACLAMYVPEAGRETEAEAMVRSSLAALHAARSKDARVVWMRAAIAAAATAADLEPLLAIAEGRPPIDDLVVDQEMRWSMAVKAVAFGLEDADERLAAESERDRSDRGARALVRATASQPTSEAKAEAWRRINGDGYGSHALTRAAMWGFAWRSQRELLAPYHEPFFANLRDVFATRDHPIAHAYITSLFPDRWGEPEVVDRARKLLAELRPDESALRRELLERIDELERVIRVRDLAERAGMPAT